MRTRQYISSGAFLFALCFWTIFTTFKELEPYSPSSMQDKSSTLEQNVSLSPYKYQPHDLQQQSIGRSDKRNVKRVDDSDYGEDHEMKGSNAKRTSRSRSIRDVHEDQGTSKDNDNVLHELDILSGGYQYTQGTKGEDIGKDKEDLKCPPPLVPFHNRIIQNDIINDNANSTNSTNSMPFSNIPRIMHVTMKSRCLPRDLAATMDRWKEKLPYHSIFLHDDEAVSRLIDQEWPEFPGLHKAMKCVLYKGAMKIDVWRVLMLFRYGGLYSDMDNWALDPFTEETMSGGVNDLSAFFFYDPFNRPSQWFMSTEPGHPMMYLAMKQIIHNLLKMDNMHRPRVVFVTGPGAVSTAYHNFLTPVKKNQANIYQNDVVLTGILNKKVFKTSSERFISIKKGYNETVSYNATMNVTRRERIAMDADMPHWTEVRGSNVGDLEKRIPKTCQGYLESITNGSIAEVPTIAK